MKNKNKKTTKDKKLLLTTDKVRDLRPDQLADVAGGHCCLTYPSGGGNSLQ